jgi:ABC-type cobalamin/Fe3+-siderophores transport system ATPase subunit
MKIKVENLHFSYGAKKVLNISSAGFEHGKIYGIEKKNGVGKTTCSFPSSTMPKS